MEDKDRYEAFVINPRYKPMSQITEPRPTLVIVTDKITGKRVAIDYMKNAHANKYEGIRLLKEEEYDTFVVQDQEV